MKILCKIFGHKWVYPFGTVYINRCWVCKQDHVLTQQEFDALPCPKERK